MRLLQDLRPVMILAAFGAVVLFLWVLPAMIHHGTVVEKERIPATIHRNADGTIRTTVDAYYITIQKRSGEQSTFRVSEETFNHNTVGEKYSS